MPLYTFCLRSNAAVEKDFFFSMKEVPKIGEMVSIGGKKWIRIISKNVNGLVKGSDNPCSVNQFMQKSYDRKGSVGNLIDESKELSEKRKKKFGRDPIQEKYFKDYSKKRGGRKHHLDN